jgi:hypothetical protein
MRHRGTLPINALKLILEFNGETSSGIGIVIKTSATPVSISTCKVIGHKNEAVPASYDRILDPGFEGCLKEWPTQIKLTTQITEGLNDADCSLGHDRQIKPAIHTLKCSDLGGVFASVSAALHRQVNEGPGVTRIQIE